MENLYEMLLGRPRHPHAGADVGTSIAPDEPFSWHAADGAGPDRLFNRYRRLRLSAQDQPAGAGLTARCPAAPSAVRA